MHWVAGAARRSFRSTSNPLARGSRTSQITTSKVREPSSVSALNPSEAVTTR